MTNLIFCGVALAAVMLVSWALFPFAAMSQETLIAAQTPMDAELMEDVQLGEFGDVPVLDLMLHYIDNPPEATDAATSVIRFQGC